MPVLDVDLAAQRFDHGCLLCGTERHALHPVIHLTPVAGSLSITPCPQCGTVESLNNALTEDDTRAEIDLPAPHAGIRVVSEGGTSWRREQARHILALYRLHAALTDGGA